MSVDFWFWRIILESGTFVVLKNLASKRFQKNKIITWFLCLKGDKWHRNIPFCIAHVWYKLKDWKYHPSIDGNAQMERSELAGCPTPELDTVLGVPHPLPQILQKSLLSPIRAEKIGSIISINYKRPLLCRRQPSLQEPCWGRLSPKWSGSAGDHTWRHGGGTGLGWRACGGIVGRQGTLAALWWVSQLPLCQTPPGKGQVSIWECVPPSRS